MIGQVIDVTSDLNANNTVQIDVGGWENVIIQTVSPSGTITLQGSNDGGSVEGSTVGNPASATNFTTIVATKMADGTTSSSLATAGLYKLTQPPKYLKIGGASAAVTKCLVFLSKVI